MSKRWKPTNRYYYVTASGEVRSYPWKDDYSDKAHYEFGNCFETEEQAADAATKIRELLLNMAGEAETSSDQLPKLTAEVFDRPDCPEWAKYAAVCADGSVRVFLNKPSYQYRMYWYDPCSWWERQLHGVKYDASDWQNSLIERPVKEDKLPEWCKVDAIGWHKRCGYFKVTYIDDVSKRVDIQQVKDKSRGYLSFHTLCNEVLQAHLRPYNAGEMKALVGKVLELDRNLDLVTSYDKDSDEVYADSMWMSSDELLSNGYTIDGEICGVLEHLENGEWRVDLIKKGGK